MEKYKRIILYCDYGLDDAIATTYILDRRQRFDEVYIVPIGGNQSVENAFDNAFRILTEYEGSIDGVTVVDTRSIPQNFAVLEYAHGADGLGDFLPKSAYCLCGGRAFLTRNGKKTSVPVISTQDLVKAFKTPKEGDTVLSLGPCTVPRLLGIKPENTILMGGCVNCPPNYGEYEFNEALDPEAFAEFSRDALVATLDTCSDTEFDLRKYFWRSDSLYGRLSYRLFQIDLLASKTNKDMPFVAYDLVAAACALNPQAFSSFRVDLLDRSYKSLVLKDPELIDLQPVRG